MDCAASLVHECHVSAPGLFIADSDQKWPGVEAGWSLFCRHPAVARILEALRLDLRRSTPIMTWDEWIAMSDSDREEFWKKTRYLVLDRQERKLYVGTHPNVTLFLSMVPLPGAPEPDDDDEDEVPDEEFVAKVNAAESEEILRPEPRISRLRSAVRFWRTSGVGSIRMSCQMTITCQDCPLEVRSLKAGPGLVQNRGRKLPAGLTAAISAVSLAEATAAEAPICLGTGFIDGQGSSTDFSAVERCHRFFGFSTTGHFHKAKASGAASVTISHDADTINGAMGFKQGANGIFRRCKTEVSYKDFHCVRF